MRNGPMAMPNFSSAASICCGSGARHQQLVRGLAVAGDHAVADEAVADPGDHGDLADLLGERPCAVASTSSAVVAAAHDLEQAHDVRGAEEVQADHILRTAGEGGDRVEVERRGVGGEDGARAHDGVELLEHLLLDLAGSRRPPR